MLRQMIAFAVALTVVALSGCGGGSPPPAAPSSSSGGTPTAAPKEPKKKTGGGEAYSADKATGSVKGVVKFDGEAPKSTKVNLGGDAKCEAMHAGGMQSENVVVKDGKLQNVIVHVKSGAEKWKFETPTDKPVFDQVGCQYVPHVMGVMVDQKFTIRNSDDMTHNVHATPSINSEFNMSQPKKGEASDKSFSEPEVAARIQCDVHKWMGAYIGVFAHPFFAVTNDKGEFEIKLPPGDYELEAWQETSGSKLDGPHTVKVTVKEGAPATQDFTFKAK